MVWIFFLSKMIAFFAQHFSILHIQIHYNFYEECKSKLADYLHFMIRRHIS
jgi:hypothetical protein